MVAFAYLMDRTDLIPDIMAITTSPVVSSWDKIGVAIDWINVYVVAPTAGCVWAGWVWNLTLSENTMENMARKVDGKYDHKKID